MPDKGKSLLIPDYGSIVSDNRIVLRKGKICKKMGKTWQIVASFAGENMNSNDFLTL